MAKCPECGTKVKATPGKLVICPDCDTKFRAPAETAAAASSKKAPPAKKADSKKDAKPAAKPDAPVTEDMYGFTADEEDLAEVRRKREEDEARKAAEKKKADKPVIEVKRKNIGDLAVWQRIDKAMIWLLVGIGIWAAEHLLFGLVLFLGMVQGPEYAGPVVQRLIRPDQPPLELGDGDALDRMGFVVAMLGGMEMYGFTFVLMVLIQVLSWIRMGVWMTAYGMSWPSAPVEGGGRGQLISLFTLGGLNFVFSFFLVFLPLVGAYPYTPLPLVGSEIAMAEYNMERSQGLHLFWAYSPFLETLMAFIIFGIRYFEPVMIAYFTWTVADAIKDDQLESAAVGAVKMGCSVMFILLAYQLFAISGTSPVLVKVLRVIYLLWYGAMIVWIIRMAAVVMKCRDTFKFYFYPDQD